MALLRGDCCLGLGDMGVAFLWGLIDKLGGTFSRSKSCDEGKGEGRCW